MTHINRAAEVRPRRREDEDAVRTQRRSDEIEEKKKPLQMLQPMKGMMTEGERACSSEDDACGVPAGVLLW